MSSKSLVVLISIVAGMIMSDANRVEARGFGFRGGTSVRLGIGGSGNRTVRYYGPGFYAAPRTNGATRPGAAQYQQRPWYYSRSGPFEYYRPYNQLDRSR